MAGKPHCAVCRTAVVSARGDVCPACQASETPPTAGEVVDVLPPPPPAPEVEVPPPSPATVRALRSFWTTYADGRPWYVGWRDILHGALAARLVDLHPDLVEPFPPVAP